MIFKYLFIEKCLPFVANRIMIGPAIAVFDFDFYHRI